MRSEALAMNFEAIEGKNSLIFQSDNNNSRVESVENRRGRGRTWFWPDVLSPKKRENERKKKTFELIHIKRKDYSEEKSGRYVHSTTEERKKNGLSTVAFHPTKGEIMIEGKMTGETKKKPCKLLVRSLLEMMSSANNSRCGRTRTKWRARDGHTQLINFMSMWSEK